MVLLTPKIDSMLYLCSDGSIKRAKGISRHLVTSTAHDIYREVFLYQSEASYQIIILRSKFHTRNTVIFRKRGLSAWEDKGCWLDALSPVPDDLYFSVLPPKRRRGFPPLASGDIIFDL